MDEYLDVVNEKDEVVGRELRSVIYAAKRSDFRVVNVFLKNFEGRLWIPRRTATKKIFPLALDISAAGHVESGETYEEAMKREVMEELSIDTDTVHVKTLGIATPQADGTSAFQKVYEIESDEVPKFNTDDFVEYYWLTPREVVDRVAGGDTSKDDLPKLVRKFYLNF